MLTEATLEHISQVDLPPGRPVIICDVDEVVVHFIRGLEAYLDRNEMWLDASSFALNGNVKRKADNEPLDTDELRTRLADFFEQDIHRLEAIADAAPTLNALAHHAEVVMLTNLPAKFRTRRIENLFGHGLEFPVITNEGPKGPAVEQLLQQHSASAIFIDDIPTYLNSVKDHCEHVELIHFMQDERFARHVDHVERAGLRTDNWQDVHNHVLALLCA